MVDAQRAGRAAVGREQCREVGIPVVDEPVRMVRRQAPVLAQRVEDVGRRTDRRVGDVRGRICPDIGGVGVDADGEIAIERDAVARRIGRDRLQLFGRQPLQVHAVADLVVCRRCVERNVRPIGRAIGGRPRAYVAPESHDERFEDREAPQRVTLQLAPGFERGAALDVLRERSITDAQQLVFQRCDAGIIDETGSPQTRRVRAQRRVGEQCRCRGGAHFGYFVDGDRKPVQPAPRRR